MEIIMLWGLMVLGIVLLFINCRVLPLKKWLLIFLFASYTAVILGTIIVEEKMLAYPVKLLGKHFNSSLQYEMLLLPIVCLYFYRTTRDAKLLNMIIQSAVYSAVLTSIEFLLERYTDVIEYYSWQAMYTFVSLFFFFLLVRAFIWLVEKKS